MSSSLRGVANAISRVGPGSTYQAPCDAARVGPALDFEISKSVKIGVVAKAVTSQSVEHEERNNFSSPDRGEHPRRA